MKFITILFFITTVINLTSCDPAKILIIKANSSNSSITIFGKEQFLPYASLKTNHIFQVTVSSIDTLKGCIIEYNYGMGNWSNSAIADLTKNIDSILISTANSTYWLRSKSEIEEYLKKHRSGYAGSRLTIKTD